MVYPTATVMIIVAIALTGMAAFFTARKSKSGGSGKITSLFRQKEILLWTAAIILWILAVGIDAIMTLLEEYLIIVLIVAVLFFMFLGMLYKKDRAKTQFIYGSSPKKIHKLLVKRQEGIFLGAIGGALAYYLSTQMGLITFSVTQTTIETMTNIYFTHKGLIFFMLIGIVVGWFLDANKNMLPKSLRRYL